MTVEQDGTRKRTRASKSRATVVKLHADHGGNQDCRRLLEEVEAAAVAVDQPHAQHEATSKPLQQVSCARWSKVGKAPWERPA